MIYSKLPCPYVHTSSWFHAPYTTAHRIKEYHSRFCSFIYMELYIPAVRYPARRHGDIPYLAYDLIPAASWLSGDQAHQSCRDVLYRYGAYPSGWPSHWGGLPAGLQRKQAVKGPISVTRETMCCVRGQEEALFRPRSCAPVAGREFRTYPCCQAAPTSFWL